MGNNQVNNASYGYRIIKVAPNSPAKKAGLIEFLDYITDISSPNHQAPFTGNYGEFYKIIQNSEDQEATMKVYNMLYRTTRIVTIVPSKKWENSDSLMGALVRYEEYATAHERVLRVAKVHENSPASIAGLEPENDYILGSPQYLYTDLNELANFIEMTQEKETIKSLELYIYSSLTNSVRSTLIIPNKNWGGQGHLGCEFALGILNHLPHLEDATISSFADSHDHVDRLDADDDDIDKKIEAPSKVNTAIENPEIKESKRIEEASKPSEPKPEVKLRPPTDSEIGHKPPTHSEAIHATNSAEHNAELPDQKTKLLHLAHQHKVSVKSIAKPFIKPGNSSANPFHHTEQENNAKQESEPTVSTSQTNTGSLEKTIDKTVEEEKSSQPKGVSVQPEVKTHVEALDAHVVEKPKQNEEPQGQVESNQVKNDLPGKIKEASPEKPSADVKQNQENDLNKENVKEEPSGEKEPLEEIQEKQICKTTIEYNFFSKKLNKDYKIKSINLFNVEEFEQMKI